MKFFNIMKLLILLTTLTGKVTFVQSQINYYGVAFEPYTRYDNAAWNSYSIDEITQMLQILLTNHNAVATYSMGVSSSNMNNNWDQADSNCLIARAAAQINQQQNSVVLSVSQGIFQNDDPNVQQAEIDHAFSAAADANGIFPGTVYNLVFTNEYVTDGDNGPKVLNMLQQNKDKAQSMGLRIGTRVNTCGEIWGGPNQNILQQIAQQSDFIMCNLYPPPNTSDPGAAVQAIGNAYYSARDGFWKNANPNIEVMIGETGWSSSGQNFFNPPDYNNVPNLVSFWNQMKNWANSNQVKVHMFEAFDEPWKTGLPGEKTFGWWYRSQDNSPTYIEKATGTVFQ